MTAHITNVAMDGAKYSIGIAKKGHSAYQIRTVNLFEVI